MADTPKSKTSTKSTPSKNPKKAERPKTEDELLIEKIKVLVEEAKKIGFRVKEIVRLSPSLRDLYGEEPVADRLLNIVDLALDFEDTKIYPTSTETIANNPSLKELWSGEYFSDAANEEAIEKLTLKFKEVALVVEAGSYKKFFTE